MEINNVQGARSDINEMLSKIREISNNSKVFSENKAVEHVSSFENVMSTAKNALNSVNEITTASEKIKDAYVAGDSNVSMAQVILSSQKSKLAFEGLLTVRNKILEAYKDIMNMPI